MAGKSGSNYTNNRHIIILQSLYTHLLPYRTSDRPEPHSLLLFQSVSCKQGCVLSGISVVCIIKSKIVKMGSIFSEKDTLMGSKLTLSRAPHLLEK